MTTAQIKTPNTKRTFKKKPGKNLPPLAFLVLDLTDKSLDAKIIKISQLIVHANGETELSYHLFNNGEQPISDQAYKYHKITAEMLKDKPDVSTFNFNQARNIVVWDGQVTRNILRKNGVKKFAPIINLHSLARYLEKVPEPIRLNDYALKVSPNKRNMLEFKLQKPENKVLVLPEIYKFISDKYLEVHTENSAGFLVAVGRSHNKKKFNESIKQYLAKREEFRAKNVGKNKPKDEATKPAEEAPKKKIIVVAASQSQTKQGVKKVTIVKRKK